LRVVTVSPTTKVNSHTIGLLLRIFHCVPKYVVLEYARADYGVSLDLTTRTVQMVRGSYYDI
jgi:hypothetical protein